MSETAPQPVLTKAPPPPAPPAPVAPAAPAGSAARRATLRDRLAARFGDAETRPQLILAWAGGALLVLGLGVILLGWRGASQTPYAFEQVNYLISGGLFGLGLVIVGGFLYFGSWLARIAAAQRRATAPPPPALPHQGGHAAAPVTAVAPPGYAHWPDVPPYSYGNGSGAPLVATATGTMLHRADCSVVAGRSGLRSVAPEDYDSFKPCRLCDPLSP